MNRNESMVFFLTGIAEVWSDAVPVARSVPAGLEGQLVSRTFGQTLEQLQQRFPDMVLITESEALDLMTSKIGSNDK